jgi:hypothetical protein
MDLYCSLVLLSLEDVFGNGGGVEAFSGDGFVGFVFSCFRNWVGCFPLGLLCRWVFRVHQQCLWRPIPYSWQGYGRWPSFARAFSV